jgi:hypothetical protein
MGGSKESARVLLQKSNGGINDISEWCLHEGTGEDK